MTPRAFTVGRDAGDAIATVTFDRPDESVNTLSTGVGDELQRVLDELEADATVSAVVFLSGKDASFVAGADLDEFVGLASREEAERLSRTAQAMIGRIATFAKPIVMGIHGACLGGGLELALAGHYRVATDAPETQLGLPEVKLGVIPAASGCQRLPRLIGVRAALGLILAGRSVRGSRALRLGLVDEIVPRSILRDTARAAAGRLADGWRPERAASKGLLPLLLDRNPVGRWLVCRQARKRVLARSGGHYPAPMAALEAISHGQTRGFEAGLEREAELFGQLAVGSVSRKLVGLFFATSALKKDLGVEVDERRLEPLRRLGVVGSGFMGSSIAGVAALQAQVDVRLRDTDATRVAKGVRAARSVLDQRLRRRRLDRHEHRRLSALISGTTDHSGFGRRDLVIEAVFEDLAVKRRVIAELEQVVDAGCLIASNTSTIPIARLQEGARHPERIVGMHFFSPVQKMPLVEIIRTPATADPVTAMAVRFARRLGKTVLVVNDAPGFWVNRILAPYLNEAGWLLQEGAAIDVIDRTMTRFGFPVGPITLLDEVGLDVAAKASVVLGEAFGARLEPAPGVGRLVEEGRLGRKSGGGFYRYQKAKRRGVDASAMALLDARPSRGPGPAEIERRLVLSLLNEAGHALAEGVVREPRDADIAAVFGFGFPPFLGGPLRYVDDLGVGSVVEDLERCASAHGDRFRPATLLVEMARTDRKFYQS